jgi:hypothetical protein
MGKFYLFALIILSFHALPVGELAFAAQPFGGNRFLGRAQANELRDQQRLDQLQRDQQLNQVQRQLDQLQQHGQTNPVQRQDRLDDVQQQLNQIQNEHS